LVLYKENDPMEKWRESTTPVLVCGAETEEVIDGTHVNPSTAEAEFTRRSAPVAESRSTSWCRAHHVVAPKVLHNRDFAARAPSPALFPRQPLQLGFAVTRVGTPSGRRSVAFATPNV